MRRQTQQEVAEAARRRLDLLRRELEQAGLRRVDEPLDDFGADPTTGELPDAQAVPRAGRHARPGGPGGLATWVQDQVPPSLRGRVGLGRGPVLLVVLVVAVACVVTGVAVMRMGGGSDPVSPAPTARSAPLVSTAPGSSPSGWSSASPASASRTVTVDVAGKVRRPGVRTLPVGSRVVDALRRAGGARGGVDLTGLNLARVLVDGEQILVGRAAAAVPGGLAGSSSASAPPATGSLVNLNTATEEQLDTLPGVGPVTAQKILQWRAAHGAFSAVDELLEVDGIGEKTLADLAPLVTL
jgi:competence protein ComEA